MANVTSAENVPLRCLTVKKEARGFRKWLRGKVGLVGFVGLVNSRVEVVLMGKHVFALHFVPTSRLRMRIIRWYSGRMKLVKVK